MPHAQNHRFLLVDFLTVLGNDAKVDLNVPDIKELKTRGNLSNDNGDDNENVTNSHI